MPPPLPGAIDQISQSLGRIEQKVDDQGNAINRLADMLLDPQTGYAALSAEVRTLKEQMETASSKRHNFAVTFFGAACGFAAAHLETFLGHRVP
jgi:chromosome segregation ATPase